MKVIWYKLLFALSYCNYISIHTSHNAFVYEKLLIESKLACNLEMWNTSVIQILYILSFILTPTTTDPIIDSFSNSIIIQMHILWRNYLVGNGALCKVMCFVAPKSMIHLQTLCVALQMWIHLCPMYCWQCPSPSLLLCDKIVQCGPVCRNRHTSLSLLAKMDRPLYFKAKTLPYFFSLGFFLLML